MTRIKIVLYTPELFTQSVVGGGWFMSSILAAELLRYVCTFLIAPGLLVPECRLQASRVSRASGRSSSMACAK